MITPAQSRAGRALVDWSQEQLAEAAYLGLSTIRDFEKRRRVPTHNKLAAIRAALESAGVEFTHGGRRGIRLKQQESVEGLTQQIDHMRERISHEEPSGPASPERGMQQLRSAKDKNELVKLRNRRTRLRKGPR